MNEDSSSVKTKKLLFAGLSFLCLLLALPVGRLSIYLFAPNENYLGPGGLKVALLGFTLTFTVGLTSSIISLLRCEQPKRFPLLTLIANATLLLWIFSIFPVVDAVVTV